MQVPSSLQWPTCHFSFEQWEIEATELHRLEAGVIAGNVYLSSYSLNLGASGSTFYDDAITEFFSPHASAKSAMIAIGVGIPDYKARPGKILVGKARKTTVPA